MVSGSFDDGYYKAAPAANCPKGHRIGYEEACKHAASKFTLKGYNKQVNDCDARPSGCFWDQNGYAYLNTCVTASASWGGVGGLCDLLSVAFYKADPAANCPFNHRIESVEACQAAASSGLVPLGYNKQAYDCTERPAGCFWDQNCYAYLNACFNASASW